MSNDDRIKNWRARRKGRADAGVPEREAQDVDDGETQARVSAGDDDQSVPPIDVRGALAMVLDTLASVAHATVVDRRRIYSALETDLERGLAEAGMSEEHHEYGLRQLRLVVRFVETDIRAGVDVFATGYMPESLLADSARLREGLERRTQQRRTQEESEARRRASREDVAHAIPLKGREAAELEVLRQRVARIHAGQFCAMPGTLQSRVACIIPLIRLQLHIIQGESRIALLWSLVGPAVLLSLISSLYYLSGTTFIIGMDVPTFSLLGATTWIMFRQIIFRTSTAYVSMRGIINLEVVTPLTVTLVLGAIYLGIYIGVFVILIGLGHSLGMISLPVNWSGFLACVVVMGVGGVAFGLIFGAITTIWHFFLRFAPVIERGLELFSSVFFVSEQLPVQYRHYILWSPFAHGLQLMRSAYFASYTSHDASLAYFLVSVVFLTVLGFALERLARTNVQPM